MFITVVKSRIHTAAWHFHDISPLLTLQAFHWLPDKWSPNLCMHFILEYIKIYKSINHGVAMSFTA